MKAIFLQNFPYSQPEGRLADYHGAIFAEEFQKLGWESTKMLVGDPEKFTVQSPLLSISTQEQRTSPEFWKQQNCDIIVYYNGATHSNIPVMCAIKEGSPRTKLIMKMDAGRAPFLQKFSSAIKMFHSAYVGDKNMYVVNHEHAGRHPFFSLLAASARTLQKFLPSYISNVGS